jgi:hypothetical protein
MRRFYSSIMLQPDIQGDDFSDNENLNREDESDDDAQIKENKGMYHERSGPNLSLDSKIS